MLHMGNRKWDASVRSHQYIGSAYTDKRELHAVSEVGRVGGAVSCLLLAKQVHYANLPCCGDGLGGPAAVIHM